MLLSSRWVSLRQDYLDLGAQEGCPDRRFQKMRPVMT
jgi:hypothetical protein